MLTAKDAQSFAKGRDKAVLTAKDAKDAQSFAKGRGKAVLTEKDAKGPQRFAKESVIMPNGVQRFANENIVRALTACTLSVFFAVLGVLCG